MDCTYFCRNITGGDKENNPSVPWCIIVQDLFGISQRFCLAGRLNLFQVLWSDSCNGSTTEVEEKNMHTSTFLSHTHTSSLKHILSFCLQAHFLFFCLVTHTPLLSSTFFFLCLLTRTPLLLSTLSFLFCLLTHTHTQPLLSSTLFFSCLFNTCTSLSAS